MGPAAFSAERRTKELGIRKCVGASVTRLLLLLTSDATRSVVVGNLVAAPLAYAGTSMWLQDFAVRMEVELFLFLPALILTLVIAFITVGGRSYKAARINPVDALRNE